MSVSFNSKVSNRAGIKKSWKNLKPMKFCSAQDTLRQYECEIKSVMSTEIQEHPQGKKGFQNAKNSFEIHYTRLCCII
jgi:hypothetical protein